MKKYIDYRLLFVICFFMLLCSFYTCKAEELPQFPGKPCMMPQFLDPPKDEEEDCHNDSRSHMFLEEVRLRNYQEHMRVQRTAQQVVYQHLPAAYIAPTYRVPMYQYSTVQRRQPVSYSVRQYAAPITQPSYSFQNCGPRG